MTIWNDSARALLDQHVAKLRRTVAAGGVDVAAMAENLRRHIETELSVAGKTVVERADVERILRDWETSPPSVETPPPPARPATKAIARKSLIAGGMGFSALFGVALPIVALLVEIVARICDFFDPIPSAWHVAAIALVPLANALGLHGALGGRPSPTYLKWVADLNGFAFGIAIYYALWFLPVIPFAAIAVLFFGVGLLPLAPLLSAVSALLVRQGLSRRAKQLDLVLPRAWPWVLAGFACLLALEAPQALHSWAVEAIAHGSPAKQARAVRLLRSAGSEERLLRGCYQQRGSMGGEFRRWLFGSSSPDDFRLAYYRVTGRAFNRVPAPRHNPLAWQTQGYRDLDEWVWDDSLGDHRVGQRLKGLYLQESRLDGKLQSEAALGTLEWTLVFRNDHAFQQREARALVQLPPGALVSRLTLWIDGEEREAAFGGRSQVTQAYQAVVRQRRDPVLVTTKGPDRVLVQCFPIAPKGGTMKVRIGLTLPLVLEDPATGRLALPRIIEQNFSAAPGLLHAVWIEGDHPLSSSLAEYRPVKSGDTGYAMRGALSPEQFTSPAAGLTMARDSNLTEEWWRDPSEPSRRIVQKIAQQPVNPGAVAIVIDGSAGLAPSARALAEVLEKMSLDFSVQVRIASDTPLVCPTDTPREVAAWLRAQEFAGGQDPTTALREALDSLGDEKGTLLWIHGEQPMAWEDASVIEQTLARRRGQVRVVAFPAVAGGNVILEKLADTPDLTVAARLGEVGTDLTRTLHDLHDGAWLATRQSVPAAEFSPMGRESSIELWRLWAADEVDRLMAGAFPQRAAATKLAVAAHIVTPVSGAVVLETKQQYDAAGLEPTDPNAVQSVPDASQTLVLLMLALLTLAFGKHLVARSQKARDLRVAAVV